MGIDGMPKDIPAGSRLIGSMDAVMASFAPVYAKRSPDDRVMLGFRVEAQHCNPRGHCHGGTWATVADVLMGLNIGFVTNLSGPTVSMAVDFVGAALLGQWVQGSARVLRKTYRLGFADCLFTADGEPALRANAVYRRKFAPYSGFLIEPSG